MKTKITSSMMWTNRSEPNSIEKLRIYSKYFENFAISASTVTKIPIMCIFKLEIMSFQLRFWNSK